MLKRASRAAVIAAVAFVMCSYYLWVVRLTGDRFYWRGGLNGYYNQLGRAFAKGQLHFEAAPSPELLALPNPWDPEKNHQYKLHDAVLFNQRYYLYHGAAPAALLFAPYWRLTGYDLPENFAVFLLCLTGFGCFSAALLKILRLLQVDPATPWIALMLLAMGASTCVPYLLNRADFYEIAISGGLAATAAAVLFLVQSVGSTHALRWLVPSGLCFGLAIACRPHLGIAGACVLFALVLARRSLVHRDVWAFAIPFAAIGALVAAYNYARFGNAFEFGVRYLLAGAVDQQRVKMDGAYLLPGLYFQLLCAPAISSVFPWVEQVWRMPFNSFAWDYPEGFFIEPMIGAIYLAPFVVLAAFIPSPGRSGSRDLSLFLRALLGAALVIVLFIAIIGFETQRYQIDYLPLLVFLSLISFAVYPARIRLFASLAIAAGIFVNAALAVAGPYNAFERKWPINYVRLAGWFSLGADRRPLLDPEVDVRLNVSFKEHESGTLEPLLFLGHRTHRQLLFVEHLPGKLRLVSENDASRTSVELDHPGGRSISVEARVSGQRFTVSAGGHPVLTHDLPKLVMAPRQLAIGENSERYDRMHPRFTGTIQVEKAECRASNTIFR